MSYWCVLSQQCYLWIGVSHHLIKYSNVVGDESFSNVGAIGDSVIDAWQILCG